MHVIPQSKLRINRSLIKILSFLKKINSSRAQHHHQLLMANSHSLYSKRKSPKLASILIAKTNNRGEQALKFRLNKVFHNRIRISKIYIKKNKITKTSLKFRMTNKGKTNSNYIN